MFRVVQSLGRLVVRLYRSESARLLKQSKAEGAEAVSSTQAAQTLLRIADDMTQASRETYHAHLQRADHANQLEKFFK